MAEDNVDEELLEEDTETEEPEDIDEADLADLGVDDDLLEDIEAPAEDETEVSDEVEEEPAAAPAPPSAAEDDDEEEEDDEEEDVEASLDVILKEKLVVADEEAEEEAPEQEDRVEGTLNRVLPKQPDEFVCTSCFLVKHPSQLADGGRMLCRDCV